MNAELWAGLGMMAVSFLIGWGATRAKVMELDRRNIQLELNMEKIKDSLAGLNDVYVNYKHFNEAMASIRESYKDLKEDMKKVLELLSRN